MKVLYEEGPRALMVPAAGGVTARRGEAIDVPDEIGKQLLAQGWKQADKSAVKPAVKPQSKEKN